MLYGAAKHLALQGFWNIQQTETIYGCSIGAFLAVVLALNIEWSWLDEYFIKRPWDKLVTQNTRNLLDCFSGRGLLGEDIISEAIKPLLAAKDFDVDVTLAQFYAATKVDIHVFTVDVNQVAMHKVDVSHTTHPDLTIVQALAMSMAFPLIFRPVLWENGCYVDGGFLANFPLLECLEGTKSKPDEILALEVTCDNSSVQPVTLESHLFDVMLSTLRSMVNKLRIIPSQETVTYYLLCATADWSDLSRWWEVMQQQDLRHELIRQGEQYANVFHTAHMNMLK